MKSMYSNQHTHRQEIPRKPHGNNYAMMQMQAIIWVAQTQMQQPSVHVLFPPYLCASSSFDPLLFFNLALLSPPSWYLCPANFSPFLCFVPISPPLSSISTKYDTTWLYILEMSGLTPLGILGRHHTWWRWSLDVFLDCFYELPSLWLEQVDLHKLIN